MNNRSASSHDDIPLAETRLIGTTLADVMGETWSMWQLPMVTALGWWGEAVDAHWQHWRQATGPNRPVHEHRSELIVPDILEEDNEHALFA
jgi:hypothetical protein